MATAPRDTVRLLIPDTATPQLLTDDQLDQFLALEANSIKRAAAQALDTIASSEVMVSKVITTQDLSTDGAKVAAELRARAKSLRDQAALDDDAGDGFVFGVVEYQDGYCGPELTELPYMYGIC